MIVDPLGAEKVADLPAASDQGVGNQAAMTFVGQGFGAHDGGSSVAGGGHKVVESREEFGRLHVVGIGVELLDAPACVGRIGQSFAAPSAQIDEMAIFNSGIGERCV